MPQTLSTSPGRHGRWHAQAVALLALEHLDREQRDAVTERATYVRIIAPAGSGKTTVLAKRIEHRLLDPDRAPGKIVGVSFTRTAARELQQRLADLDGHPFESTTLHALALRIVTTAGERSREFIPRLVSDAASVIVTSGAPRPTRSAMTAIATAKATRTEPPRSIKPLFDAYQKALRAQRFMDFEDLISKAADRLEANRGLRVGMQRELAGVFVDEFQDTTPEQWRLIKALITPPQMSATARQSQRIIECTIVGDPLQSIYGFAGADPHLFEVFATEFPGVVTHTLTTNYRSSESVLTASATLRGTRTETADVPGGEHPQVFIFEDEHKEAERIADLVLSALTRTGTSIAILARTHRLLNPIATALAARGIDADRRGTGSLMSDAGMRNLFRVLREHVRDAPELSWHDRLIDAMSEGDVAAAQLVELLGSFDGEARTWSVQRLASEVATWDRHRIHTNPVLLSTFHGTKGAAYDTVIICGMDSIGLPFRTEEEQRLLYVATTRARSHLMLTAARTRGGKPAELHPLLGAIQLGDAPLTAMPVLVTEHGRLRKQPEDARYERLVAWRETQARATMLPKQGIASDTELKKLAALEYLDRDHVRALLGDARAERWTEQLIDAVKQGDR